MKNRWTISDAILDLVVEQSPDSAVRPGIVEEEIEVDSLDFEDFLEDITEEEYLESRLCDRVGLEEEEEEINTIH